MKQGIIIFLIVLFILSAWAAEQEVVAGSTEKEAWQTYLFHIKWGIKTKTKQVWDGYVEVQGGEILTVLPFERNEKPDESKLVSETSWSSTSYLDAEGIYLFIHGSEKTKVSIFTKTHNFEFMIGEVNKGETKQEMEGDIEITNETGKVLFRIAGLEKGIPGKGSATITPTTAQANTMGTWTVTYTAPKGGLPLGGGIRISWHFTHTWGEPQFSDPQGKNYVTVKTTGKSRLDYTSEHLGIFEYPFSRGRILVRIFDEPLHEDEQIIVTLGDTSDGSPGFEAPLRADEQIIRVEDCTEVPEAGFAFYRRIKHLPKVKVSPSETHRFFVVAPSLVQSGKPFELKIVVEDMFRNVVSDFEAQLEVLADDNKVKTIEMTEKDAGRLEILGLVIDEPGAHYITVKAVKGGLMGESNPIKCVAEKPPYQVVWGELHGHTEYSDGCGDVDDYFRFCRDRALLDFAAATDHDVELDAPDYDVKDMWREVNEASQRHHNPPRFCTIPAYEWSPARKTISMIAPYGDHNVYYTHEDQPIFKARDPESNTLPKLYKRLGELKNGEAQVIPHVGGAVSNWEFHDPNLESLAEIYSVHGCFEEFGRLGLDKGYLIGFVGASDSHSGQVGGFPPGNVPGHYTHGGLTAAYVPELSRQNLFSAFKNRRTYATSGVRIFLDFTINDQPMGTVIETDTTPLIKAEVIGTAPLLLVEVVKNGRVIHSWYNEYEGEEELTLLWGNHVEQDDLRDFDESVWSYYLRFVDWAGGLKAHPGKVALRKTLSFDYPQDNLVEKGENEIRWTSQTRGDWDGITLQSLGKPIELEIKLGEYQQTIDPAKLQLGMTRQGLGQSDNLLIVKGKPTKGHAAFQLKDRTILYNWNYYYLRVLQADGEMAWSSPIWIQKR